ncbi:MAG: exo-alpha-sialidase [Saprospiraceae bacterium]|nr:exo-alpha-sialidase [Saprospiraceae bacterium]
MKKKLLFICLNGLVYLAQAQFQNILIHEGPNPKEPAICMNTKNVNELVAGANGDNFYYSHDGGWTWSKGKLTSSWGVWGDPCIVADTSGNFYYSHLSNTGGETGWLDRIVIQKSTDGGASWSDGSFTGLNEDKDQDKPWMAFDAASGSLYVAWTEFDKYGSDLTENRSRILCSVSTDGAETWSEPVVVSQYSGDCIDDDHTVEGAVPAIGPNGEVYTAWSLNDTIWFDRSLDGGQIWLAQDIPISRQEGGWKFNVPGLNRCNGFPVTACDRNTGTIYVNWSDKRNGFDDTDVWLSKSTDGGNTWSAPVRVNNDPPGKHNFLTWMAVDQVTGHLFFVFYDRRDYDDWQTGVYLAYSTDGGETFANLRIHTEPFTPQPDKNFGDYTNIVAHNGQVHPIWERQMNGATSIWTGVPTFSLGLGDGDFFALQTDLASYPNPFSNTTKVRFNLAKPQVLSLTVHDMVGRVSATVFSKKQFQNGLQEVVLENSELRLPPGIYFLRLSNGRAAETCKLVVH